MCCPRLLKGVNFFDFVYHISKGGNGAYTSLLKEKPRNILLYADLLLNLLNFSKRNLEICDRQEDYSIQIRSHMRGISRPMARMWW